jgi:hypothetical protein
MEVNVALIWLVPDSVWADGSMRTVVRAVANGKRAVIHAAIKVNQSTVLPLLEQRIGGRVAVAMAGRELAGIGLAHMHAYYRAWVWGDQPFSRNPANVYWRVGDHGLVVRGFHLHPLMLHLVRPVERFVSTFDDDLALLGCPDYESLYIARDSDEAFHIDLADDDWAVGVTAKSSVRSSHSIAQWAVNCANLHHRRFFRERIRIHAGDVVSRDWFTTERRSDLVVLGVRCWLALWSGASWPLERILGISRRQLMANAAASGLTPRSVSPMPAWYAALTAMTRELSWGRAEFYLEKLHHFAFRRALVTVFGRGVAQRGIEFNRQLLLRPMRRIRRVVSKVVEVIWWRHLYPYGLAKTDVTLLAPGFHGRAKRVRRVFRRGFFKTRRLVRHIVTALRRVRRRGMKRIRVARKSRALQLRSLRYWTRDLQHGFSREIESTRRKSRRLTWKFGDLLRKERSNWQSKLHRRLVKARSRIQGHP